MALAGLEYGAIEPDAVRNCHGSFTLPGSSHIYHDWKKEGHGAVDMRRAIAASCDVYFYGLAEVLGIDRVHEAMTSLGFGKPTGIDLSGERPGLMPSQEWKRRTYKQAWFPGETVNIGIGQGYLLATPLQLAHATAVVAMRGQNFRPRLVTAVRDAQTREVRKLPPIADPSIEVKDPHHWDVIIEGMEKVMEPGGTGAAAARGASYRMAGKSGTAQVFSLAQNQKYDASRIGERLRDHAWFVAFAPADAPKLAIAVLVENGGHGGSAAAPIARRVFDAYLLGKFDAAGSPSLETGVDTQER
jgi:penicillin-binding protein 2